MSKRKATTLTDLSKALGISVQTISKALRGRPGMSEQTRSLIIRTAYQRGYISTQQAREMVRQGIAPYPIIRMRFVVVQSRESMNYNRLLMEGLRSRFSQLDHQLESYVLDEDLSDFAFEQWTGEHNILQADGLFIAPRLISGKMEEKLLTLSVPKILVNYPKPLSRVDSVIWDVYEAVCLSIDHLSRQGHRRILFVGDIRSQRGYIHRFQAYQEMMSELGEAPLHATLAGFREAFRKYSPTAVLAGIDEDCKMIYRSLIDWGVRIPEDCSFIGLMNEQPDWLP